MKSTTSSPYRHKTGSARNGYDAVPKSVLNRGEVMHRKTTGVLLLSAVVMLSGSAGAETYSVGSGNDYESLQEVADLLQPGDIVEVDGNAVYPSGAHFYESGTEDAWITIRGIRPEGGTRPELTGGTSYGINISADYYRLEGFKVTGLARGIGVFGDNILVRNCIVTGCNHGLIGYGTGTGSVTVEYCEFNGNGVPTGGATQHQIYMATDEEAHSGAVFRLQFCYLHNSVEGDNVKSRSERNEIYYNWIEEAGSSGHGLGLFAPDPEDNENVSIETAREDAAVVGNVIIQSRYSCARIGGDAPGYPTNGRYRFVNNTFILTGGRGDAIRTFNTIETLEMYNNVIYSADPDADIRVINDADGEWVHDPRTLTGSHNWVVQGATRLPSESEWTNTLRGSGSPFTDAEGKDFMPGEGSPLIDAGTASPSTHREYPFPGPLIMPAWHPPPALLPDTGAVVPRPGAGPGVDIGAFEVVSDPVRHIRGRMPRPAGGTGHAGMAPDAGYGIDGRVKKGTRYGASGVSVIHRRADGKPGGLRIVNVR